MKAYKVFSIISIVGLLFCGVLHVVSLFQEWTVASVRFEVGSLVSSIMKNIKDTNSNTPAQPPSLSSSSDMEFPDINEMDFQNMNAMGIDRDKIMKLMNALKDPSTRKLLQKMSLKVEYGFRMTKLCVRLKFKGLGHFRAMARLSKMICVNYDLIKPFLNNPMYSTNSMVKDIARVFDVMHKIYICIIISIVLISMALVAALIKMPCITVQKKNFISIGTVMLCAAAVVTGLAAVALYHSRVHLKDDYEDAVKGRLEKISGSEGKVAYTEMMKYVKYEEKFGCSYMMATVGIGMLLILILLNAAEYVCAQRNGDNEYSSNLLDQEGGYKLTQAI